MRIPPELLPEGWSEDEIGGLLVCPHGNTIEMDGEGFCGCESPIRQQGLI